MSNEPPPPAKRPFEEEERPKHFPEFIYIEEEKQEEERGKFGGSQQEYRYSFQSIGERHYSWVVRVVFLFCALILFLFVLLVAPFILLFALFNVLTFFQMKPFLARTEALWRAYKKLFVTAIGLTFGVFSPAFGLSIIMLYFLMSGQKMDEVWVERLLRAQFYKK